MNNELHLAFKIKQHLNQSLRAVPADKTERLRAARERALARQRKGSGAKLAVADGFQFAQFEWISHLVPLTVLAAGLIGISYWHQSNRANFKNWLTMKRSDSLK